MCIILSKDIDGSKVLAKTRDRAYQPKLEVVHTILNGVEVVYMRDCITDWSEGMNEFGIGIVNSSLTVGYDENEKKIIKKTGRSSKDGKKIRKTLSQKTLADAVRCAVEYNGGVKGHTLIANPEKTVSIETTSKHSPKFKIHTDFVVRTNHGHYHTDAGYTSGDNYLSSKIRKISAEKLLNSAKTTLDILPILRKKLYKYHSNFNMLRDAEKLFTSSQVLLDLTDKVFTLVYRENRVEEFMGIRRELPSGYSPKIKISIRKISD